MNYNLGHYLGVVDGAVGGEINSLFDPVEIVNQAGQSMLGMHSWRFLERTPIDLSLTADQAFISLPADFGSILGITTSSPIFSQVKVADTNLINWLRQHNTSGTDSYVVASTFQKQSPQVDATTSAGFTEAPLPVLEVYPISGVDVVDVFALNYRAGWLALANEEDIPELPPYMLPLFETLVRAWSTSYGDPGALTGPIDGVMQSLVAKTAMKQDAATRPFNQAMRGGHLENDRDSMIFPQSIPQLRRLR